jgi:hypothetical protein
MSYSLIRREYHLRKKNLLPKSPISPRKKKTLEKHVDYSSVHSCMTTAVKWTTKSLFGTAPAPVAASVEESEKPYQKF